MNEKDLARYVARVGFTPADFAALLNQCAALGEVPALASTCRVTVKARRVNVVAHTTERVRAVVLLAHRHGLGTLTTRPDDGSFVVGITGFRR